MARVSPEKHSELESFWRFHHDDWSRERLSQREYCELHDLPLKRFGNGRGLFKREAKVRKPGLLYRRGGLGHMSSHMPDGDIGAISPRLYPIGRGDAGGPQKFQPRRQEADRRGG